MTFRRGAAALVLALTSAALAGCAAAVPQPQQPVNSNLYRDLRRLVTLTETAGWRIDRLELENLLPDLLDSVCRVEPERRAELRVWLDERIEAEGGDVRQRWVEEGRDLDEVEELLELTRIRMALDYAVARVEDCPFWVEAEPDFAGRQISDSRWQLSAGGGGKAIFLDDGENRDVSFGGATRVVLGRSFGPRWLIMAGIEGGGSAQFPKEEDGDRGGLLFAFDAVPMAVARYTRLNSYIELEGGFLMRFLEDDIDNLIPGWRIGVSVGGRATRRGWFFPGAAFGVSYERTIEQADQPALILFKAGFRVAFDIDL